ncbi:hypothetical protein BLNAU_21405 [Blattamonas nauphoetae]|uniref:Uncharacterized protein n=1 Tax=Blattamonas nauphoetae TaxID=2049346 RepID=A0ABQ9WVY4_9EUKA|nr:hypothetical protein BLNAU_21405 [Blattamonas nauphoetae]
MKIVSNPVWLSTPTGLTLLGIEDYNRQQAVHETVFQQVLAPSEKYIWHLCVNRSSIIDRDTSKHFLTLLAQILRICPYYQPAMDFVLNMPVLLSIPGCLTFFDDDSLIWSFLEDMVDTQQEWNRTQREVRQMWKTVCQMLKMEGFEDAIEAKLRNVKTPSFGVLIVAYSIRWNNLQGINLPRL